MWPCPSSSTADNLYSHSHSFWPRSFFLTAFCSFCVFGHSFGTAVNLCEQAWPPRHRTIYFPTINRFRLDQILWLVRINHRSLMHRNRIAFSDRPRFNWFLTMKWGRSYHSTFLMVLNDHWLCWFDSASQQPLGDAVSIKLGFLDVLFMSLKIAPILPRASMSFQNFYKLNTYSSPKCNLLTEAHVKYKTTS